MNETTTGGIDGIKASMENAGSAEKKQQKKPDSNDDSQKPKQADIIVEFVLKDYELFHDENGAVYACDKETDIVLRIDCRVFSDGLRASFYKEANTTIGDASFKMAITTLIGLGRMDGDCRNVHIRVAAYDGGYLVDLANPDNTRCVYIQPGKWEVLDKPPVHFLRPLAMRPLPEPCDNGSITPLWAIANIPSEDRILIVAWLLECFRPDRPYPILELLAMAGGAKSTTHDALRQLIDPNHENLRGTPKTVDDFYVAANVNHVLSFENISNLPWQIQDAMCTIATGGGHAKRMLYTDADEIILKAKRPIIINGISAAITRQDAIDRTISLELQPIKERKDIARLKQEFEARRATIFTGLLDIMADALQRLPEMKLPSDERPRLVEFAYFGMAIAQSMGKTGSDFMHQFNERRQETIARTIDASPVATALVDWFEDKNWPTRKAPLKNLFAEIEEHKPHRAENWPRSAKGFGDALRRAAPALLHMGIEVKSLGKIGSNIQWQISPLKKKNQTSSRECRASRDEHDIDDIHDMDSGSIFNDQPKSSVRGTNGSTRHGIGMEGGEI